MGNPDYSSLVERQREYFLSGNTRPTAWRKTRLEALKALFTENHDELCGALWKDLRRNVTDADPAEPPGGLSSLLACKTLSRRSIHPDCRLRNIASGQACFALACGPGHRHRLQRNQCALYRGAKTQVQHRQSSSPRASRRAGLWHFAAHRRDPDAPGPALGVRPPAPHHRGDQTGRRTPWHDPRVLESPVGKSVCMGCTTRQDPLSLNEFEVSANTFVSTPTPSKHRDEDSR